jgi:hypothetical protein
LRFTKRPGVQSGKNVRDYRQSTRQDFRLFCAYCFRHEGEVGGSKHFDQDHFHPKAGPHGDPSKAKDYYNLYWSCKDCNSQENKGHQWPTPEQLAVGEIFCDPCDHDPEAVDYSRTPDGGYDAKTPAGRFTIFAIRLNERPEIRQIYTDRSRVRSQYSIVLQTLNHAIEQLGARRADARIEKIKEAAQEAARRIESFVKTDPFILTAFPPPFDINPLISILQND